MNVSGAGNLLHRNYTTTVNKDTEELMVLLTLYKGLVPVSRTERRNYLGRDAVKELNHRARAK